MAITVGELVAWDGDWTKLLRFGIVLKELHDGDWLVYWPHLEGQMREGKYPRGCRVADPVTIEIWQRTIARVVKR